MIQCNLSKDQVEEIQIGIRRLMLAVREDGRPIPKNRPKVNGLWDEETAEGARWARKDWADFTPSEKKIMLISFFEAKLLNIESEEQALDHIAAIDVETSVAV